MTKSKRRARLLSLFMAAALGTGATLDGAETNHPPAKIAVSAIFTGKVVLVDKKAKTITVEIKGKLQRFKVTALTKITKEGKAVKLAELLPGQEVTIVIRQLADGVTEVVSLTIETSKSKTQPAGSAANSGPSINTYKPFTTEPNPANISGPVISPHK